MAGLSGPVSFKHEGLRHVSLTSRLDACIFIVPRPDLHRWHVYRLIHKRHRERHGCEIQMIDNGTVTCVPLASVISDRSARTPRSPTEIIQFVLDAGSVRRNRHNDAVHSMAARRKNLGRLPV